MGLDAWYFRDLPIQLLKFVVALALCIESKKLRCKGAAVPYQLGEIPE